MPSSKWAKVRQSTDLTKSKTPPEPANAEKKLSMQNVVLSPSLRKPNERPSHGTHRGLARCRLRKIIYIKTASLFSVERQEPHTLRDRRSFRYGQIINLGYTTVLPRSDAGFALGALQQFIGILLNVFVFAAVLAKFQSPVADLLFSDKAVIRKRDGVYTMLIRVGNLRCHQLFNASIRLTILCGHQTREGEKFTTKEELEVSQPPTISGLHTIAHTIDEDSPLFDMLESGELRNVLDLKSETKCTFLFQAVFQALDPVYSCDLCSTKTYGKGSIFFDRMFEDVIQSVSNGRPTIKWDLWNDLKEEREDMVVGVRETIPARVNYQERMTNGEKGGVAFAFPFASVFLNEIPRVVQNALGFMRSQQISKDFVWESDAEPAAPPIRCRPRLSIGAFRASCGDPDVDSVLFRGPVMPFCPFSTRLGLLLYEAGVHYEPIYIDLDNKPEWYTKVVPSKETPAMQGWPGGMEDGSWRDGSAESLKQAADDDPRVANFLVSRGLCPWSLEECREMSDTILYALFAAAIVDTTDEGGLKALRFMANAKCGIDFPNAPSSATIEGSSRSDGSPLREKLLALICDHLAAIVRHLDSTEHVTGGYLGGVTPDCCDCMLAGTFLQLNIIVTSEMCTLPARGEKLRQRLNCYLRNWTSRSSWTETYLSNSIYNGAAARVIVGKLMKMAPDVFHRERVRRVCARAARNDLPYNSARAYAIAEGGVKYTESSRARITHIPRKDRPLLSFGAARVSEGSADYDDGAPRGPLVPMCLFSCRVGLLLIEAGLDFEMVMIELSDKPEWYLEEVKSGETPALKGAPGGMEDGSWRSDSGEIIETLRREDPRMADMLTPQASLTWEDATTLSDTCGFGVLTLAMADATGDKGRTVRKFCLGKCGIVPGEEVTITSEFIRSECSAAIMRAVRTIESHIAGAQDGFIGGSGPDCTDCVLIVGIYLLKCFLNVGFTDFYPVTPISLSDAGGPSLETYIKRWQNRPSWAKNYTYTGMFSGALIRAMTMKVKKFAPECMPRDRIARILSKARELDVVYKSFIQAAKAPPSAISPPGVVNGESEGNTAVERRQSRTRRSSFQHNVASEASTDEVVDIHLCV